MKVEIRKEARYKMKRKIVPTSRQIMLLKRLVWVLPPMLGAY